VAVPSIDCTPLQHADSLRGWGRHRRREHERAHGVARPSTARGGLYRGWYGSVVRSAINGRKCSRR
jgi:hypothetical protein